MDNEPTGSGHNVHVVPFFVSEDLNISGIFTAMTPWHATYLTGVIGRTTANPFTSKIIVGFEWPIQIINAAKPFSKVELEARHFERFRTDMQIKYGIMPFVGVTQTAEHQDPPDFSLELEGKTIGIDLAQLALQSRRAVNAAFSTIRDALLFEPRERFAHLAGLTLYMWFGGGVNDMGLPPRPSSRADIETILKAISNYRFDVEAFQKDTISGADSLPTRIDHQRFNVSVPGTTFYAMPMVNAVPATDFFSNMGFEIGMSYTTEASPEEIWNEIWRLARDHDNALTDILILTVGAPNRDGFVFPAEDYLVSAALENYVPNIPSLVHLNEVILHFWSSGQVAQVYPQLTAGPPAYPGRFAVPSLGLQLDPPVPLSNYFLSSDTS